jgi:hypothetical protein
MAVAGWCRSCGAYVYVGQSWECVNGHPYTDVSNHYDAATGAAVAAPWETAAPQAAAPAPAEAAAVAAPQAAAPVVAPEAEAPAPAEAAPSAPTPAQAATPQTAREAVLAAIMSAFAPYPGYAVAYGTDTDITISNEIADASWGIGKKKVEYQAVMKAVEAERIIYFWEVLKEKGAGLSFGGMESESYSTFGAKRSGKKREIVIGPGGKAIDYEWDYGATRSIVESAAAPMGWTLKVVLKKSKAQW